MKKSERDHLERVASIGCILCKYLGMGYVPAVCHHIESVRDEISDWLVLPLCTDHHTGANGVHGLRRRGFEARYKLSELDLLGLTIKEL